MIGYIGVDQYGQMYKIRRHPRKELLDCLGAAHADKMYRDPHAQHIGYVIRGLWIAVYQTRLINSQGVV